MLIKHEHFLVIETSTVISVGSVNSYACNTLDAIETKYPLVKQSSKEVGVESLF